MLNRLYKSFWSERIWLCTRVRWEDLSEHVDVYHLLWVLPFLGAIYLLRVFVHKVRSQRDTFVLYFRYLLAFGKYLGVKEKKLRSVPPNEKLEEIYRNCKSRKLNVYAIAKQLDISERAVQRWWRLRRSQDKPSILVKFTEHMFKTCFYFYTSVIGLYVIWDKEWAWDLDLIWKDYPHYNVEIDVKWYYMLGLSFYFYVILTLFKEGHRDLFLMFTHHGLAIFTYVSCWIVNFYRIAIVCLVLMDQADCLLHFLKAMRCTNRKIWYWIGFVTFFINWCVTRLYIFPVYIVHWAFKELLPTLKTEIYFLAAAHCTVLFSMYLLQLYWTWLILRIIYNFIITKKARDVRSSTSESSENSQNSK